MLPMNQKSWCRENKTYRKLKKRQKYNRKPQTQNRQKLACIMWSSKRGSQWYGTWMGTSPKMHVHSQITTIIKKNKQANKKG